MISERMSSLFSPTIRKFLMAASIIAGILCLLLVRYSQGSIKIAMLYAMYLCIMALIVFYKNSLNKYEIAIFFFLCIQIIGLAPSPNYLGNLVGTSYLLSYRYGVSSRSFVATIIDFFTRGDFISRYFVHHFIFGATAFLSFIISVLLGGSIQKATNNTKYFILFLVVLYLSSFTAPAAYFGRANFGRVEIFAMLILFLIVFIINKPVIRWIIPLLAVFVMSIHLILVFFFIPFIIIILFHSIFEKPDESKQSVFLLVATIKALLIVFLCYLLFGRGTFIFEDARSFYEHLSARTDLNFSEEFLHMTMFASLEDHLIGWRHAVNFSFSGNFSILINIPLVLLFVVFWVKCFFIEATTKMKLFFLMPILVLLYQSVAFFLFFDFGRWMIMILNVQFMLLFYLAFVRNKAVLSNIQIITPFVKRNAFFIMLICLIMTFLGPLSVMAPSERTMRIFNIFTNLTGL